MLETIRPSKKVHLISLGCARNRVDSEVMLGAMLQKGYQITDDGPVADVVVINTCGFIGPAKEESIATILEAAEWKKDNPVQKLVVSGCLTQRYKTQLKTGLPEVDLFIGTDEFHKIADHLVQDHSAGTILAKRTHYLYEGSLPKLNTLSRGSAYVKVAEGCQHQCAFCIIPAIRGKLRSRPISSVVAEVKKLVAEGVKEVNLIAQDLAAYGRDQGGEWLLDLLKELDTIEGLHWIRPLYYYPEHLSDEFLDYFRSAPKLVKYLDVPMQHGADSVLARMNRGVTRQSLLDAVQRLRLRVPEVAIRTSVMVGFPGETESEFEELKSFVKAARFDHLGCFAYSKEEGTKAGRMPDQVDEELKKARLSQIMEIQQEISAENLKEKYLGRTLELLIEGTSPESEWVYQGRLSTQAPEVDGVVYIDQAEGLRSGDLCQVEIISAQEYDLVGRFIPGSVQG